METAAIKTQDKKSQKKQRLLLLKAKTLDALADRAWQERKSVALLINEILEQYLEESCTA